MRTILVHLNVVLPDGDARDPDDIASAILAALEVGSDDDSVRELVVEAPLAEEIAPPNQSWGEEGL